LENAKIQAIDESVTFLTKYVRDSEDPEVVVCYVNMIKEQWTRQLELSNGIKGRSLKTLSGDLSETESQPKQDRHGTPLSARGLPFTPWQKGGDQLDQDDGDGPGDDNDDNDPYVNAGGDYNDPDDFGFGHHTTAYCAAQYPLARHQPDPRNAMGEQIKENTIQKRITSTSLYYPKDQKITRMQIKWHGSPSQLTTLANMNNWQSVLSNCKMTRLELSLSFTTPSNPSLVALVSIQNYFQLYNSLLTIWI
jgi:hypothetical protein